MPLHAPGRLALAAVTAALLVATVPVASAPASAAPATPQCQGEPATIVGSPRRDHLVGTPGDDVIVSNGSSEVDAGEGADLVCLTGRAPSEDGYQWIGLDAGPGDDSVVASLGDQDLAFVALGPGADTFVGGRQSDYVFGGDPGSEEEPEEPEEPDSEPDTIDTGPRGLDSVVVGDGGPLVDRVDAHARSASVVVRASGLGEGGAVSGGPGSLLAWVDESPGAAGAWSLDLGERTAALAGAPAASWSGFGRVTWAVPGTVSVHGTEGPDVVVGPLVGGDLGPGDDRAVVWSSRTGRGAGPTVLDGGPGRHEVRVLAGEVDEEPHLGLGLVPFTPADVTVDVARQRATFGSGQVVGLAGFDWYGAQTDRAATLLGGAGDDVLYGAACELRARGGGGDDVVQQVPRVNSGGLGTPSCRRETGASLSGGAGDDRLAAAAPRSTVLGGRGADRIAGSYRADRLAGGPGADRVLGESGDDVISGGPGVDVVRGGSGDDTCRSVEYGAECERPHAATDLPPRPPGSRPQRAVVVDPAGDVVLRPDPDRPGVVEPAPEAEVGDVVTFRSSYLRGRVGLTVRMRSLASADVVEPIVVMSYDRRDQSGFAEVVVRVPPTGSPSVRFTSDAGRCPVDLAVDQARAVVRLSFAASCLGAPRWVRAAAQVDVVDDPRRPGVLYLDEAPATRYEGRGPIVWAR